MARPKKAIKRTHEIKVRYTYVEYLFIEKAAHQHGINKAKFVRDKSLSHRLKPRMTEQEAETFKQLTDIAGSLRELTKKTSHREIMTLHIIKALDEVHEVIANFKSS